MHTAESTSFDNKHHLTYKDTGKSHIYTLNGKRIPGATTVGAAYPKGEGLIRWLVKQGIEEYEAKTKMTKAAAIGKIVHKYAECHMTDKKFDWFEVDQSEDSQVIRNCITQYDLWSGRHPEDKLYAAEILVASPSLNVATQIDLLVIRDGEVIVRDYKTGKKIYISALHQTALGRIMAREWLDVKCDQLEIVKFSKEPETIPFETSIVNNKGITINGTFLEYDGLLDELENQVQRNVGTYRHSTSVEKLLTNYYDSQR